MQRLLEGVRAAIGAPPRVLEMATIASLTPSPPSWFRATDRLAEVYRRLELLLLEGEVVWGALVQANNKLFRPGPDDHPALAIYATDRSFDEGSTDLQAIAHQLFRLKNTTPDDPAERRLAGLITNEMDRGMGWTVPKSLTGGREVLSSTFMVFRSHLPGRHLQSGWFPLLIHAATPAIMIVPSLYWPRTLVTPWCLGP
jgi:hypothetical protein